MNMDGSVVTSRERVGAAPAACFHCGDPVPAGSRFEAVIDGAARPTCCAGCAAVARTIAESGLAAYYLHRSALPRHELAAAEAPRDLAVYDLPEVQKPFVRHAPGGVRQATLLVEGVTCGACAWLIERRLRSLEGVRAAAFNLAARRVQVEWDEARARLSAILKAIADLGRWNYVIGFGLLMAGLVVSAHPSTPLGRGRGVVVGMLACFLIGLVWICTFYVFSDDLSDLPIFNDLGQWNLVIGIGFMAVGFSFATKWE